MTDDLSEIRRKQLHAELQQFVGRVMTPELRREAALVIAKHYAVWLLEDKARDGKQTLDS